MSRGIGAPSKVPAREPQRELNLATGATGVAIPQKSMFDPGNMQTTGGKPMQVDEQRGGLRELTPDEFNSATGETYPKQAEILGGDQSGPQTVADVQRSPAPPDPELSQRVLEMQNQVNELMQALRDERERSEDLKFQMQAFGGPAAQQAPRQQQLPNNIDPAAPATYGDLLTIAQNLFAIVPAQTIRSSWDVTSTEEQAVYQEYPQASTLAEPQRTQFIQKAVSRMRARQAKATPPAQPTASNPPQQAHTPTLARPVIGTVPLVESGATASGISEPQTQNALAEAFRDYQEAQKIRNSKERREAMKASADRIAQLQGYSDRGGFAKGGFVQRSSR